MRDIIKVKVKHGTGKQIAKIFGVSQKWVSIACTGQSNSETAKKIRKAAVNAGGDPIYE